MYHRLEEWRPEGRSKIKVQAQWFLRAPFQAADSCLSLGHYGVKRGKAPLWSPLERSCSDPSCCCNRQEASQFIAAHSVRRFSPSQLERPAHRSKRHLITLRQLSGSGEGVDRAMNSPGVFPVTSSSSKSSSIGSTIFPNSNQGFKHQVCGGHFISNQSRFEYL